MIGLLNPFAFAPPAPPPMTLAFVASAVSNGSTITVPGSVQAEDIAFLFQVGYNSSSSGVTGVTPSGWSNLFTFGAVTVCRRIERKILVSGDIGGTITGINGSTSNDKVMLVFRPSQAITGVAISTVTDDDDTVDVPSQSIAASGQATPLIVFGMCWVAAGSPSPAFSTASPSFTATVGSAGGSTSDMLVGYKIYNTSPADHTIDMNDLGTINVLQGCYIRLS